MDPGFRVRSPGALWVLRALRSGYESGTCEGGHPVRTEDSQSFTDFVSAEQAGLLRLAGLLAGDRAGRRRTSCRQRC